MTVTVRFCGAARTVTGSCHLFETPEARIRHHLKRWLWSRRATVLLVGFQAQGTLGRFLAEGAKTARIQGEEIKVAARIRQIDDYSGHADGPASVPWSSSQIRVAWGTG